METKTLNLTILKTKGKENPKLPYKWLVQWIEDDNSSIQTNLNCWDEELAISLKLEPGQNYVLPIKSYDVKYGFTIDERELSKFQLEQFFKTLNKNLKHGVLNDLKELGSKIISELKNKKLYIGYKPYKEYSPSNVYNCKRAVLFNKWANDLPEAQFKLLEKQFEEGNKSIGSNFNGEAIHNRVSYFLSKSEDNFYVNHEETLSHRYFYDDGRGTTGSITIKGRYDLLLKTSQSELVVIDIKTRQNQYQYPTGKLQEIYKEMLYHNIAQVMIYQDLINKNEIKEPPLGAILEIFSNGESRLIPVQFDDDEFEQILMYYHELGELEERHELPMIPDGYEKNSPPCSFCLFQTICRRCDECVRLICEYPTDEICCINNESIERTKMCPPCSEDYFSDQADMLLDMNKDGY